MRLGVIHERENKKIREQKYRDCLQQMEEELESLRKQNQTLQRHNSEIHELLEQKSEFCSQEGGTIKEDQDSPLNDTGYESNQY